MPRITVTLINYFVIACLLWLIALLWIFYTSDSLYSNPDPQKPAYDITAGEEKAIVSQTTQKITETLTTRLGEGDVTKGMKVFRQCAICHTPLENGPARVGPQLWNIVGRSVASQENFSYSSAMRHLTSEGKHWDYDMLDSFLQMPARTVRGTAMSFAGIKDDQTRADLILYLRSLTKSPVPLPENQ